jgi:hypothetical protein
MVSRAGEELSKMVAKLSSRPTYSTAASLAYLSLSSVPCLRPLYRGGLKAGTGLLQVAIQACPQHHTATPPVFLHQVSYSRYLTCAMPWV